MRKTILLLFLISSFMLTAQQFDKKLNGFRSQIVRSLKEYNEIPKNEVDSLQFKYLYSRKLATVNSKIVYYEFGRMTDHGYKFLAICNDGKLTIFPSTDFDAEFFKIISPLENVNIRKIDFFELFKTIKGIYDYNANPPWDRFK